ncbi:capsule biosynthesis protein CapI [Evansella clarkii]|uniref:capsule biosynthesis protein CapI n=1 Tax=Evansella clarkii TaxID=79879 RepID=UPI001AD9E848|nr:capsule biosynthesis protein CapI [Evansella clarkii]
MGYENLYLLPLVYAIVFVTFISPILFKKTNIFIIVFTAVSFTRYVILPFLIVFSQHYGGRSILPPSISSYSTAINLMFYELIIVSIFIFLLFIKLKIKKEEESNIIRFPENHLVYIIFVVFSFSLLLVDVSAINTFSFINPSESTISFGESGTLTSLIAYCLLISKYIIYLLSMSFLYKMYKVKNNQLYVFLSLFITMLNIMIIFGDNRTDLILTAIASIYIFYRLYPNLLKILAPILLILVIFLIMNVTEHRQSATITGGGDQIVDLTDTLQIYLGGPYNVAMAIETSEEFSNSRNLGNLFYDFFRPALGFNMILKDLEGFEFSNYLYNYRIYHSDHVAQIIPMVGQGYFYLGFIFAPLLHLIFYYFAYKLITISFKVRRIELLFFLYMPITRMGFAMGQNAGILINDTSYTLVLGLVVYWLNKKIKW